MGPDPNFELVHLHLTEFFIARAGGPKPKSIELAHALANDLNDPDRPDDWPTPEEARRICRYVAFREGGLLAQDRAILAGRRLAAKLGNSLEPRLWGLWAELVDDHMLVHSVDRWLDFGVGLALGGYYIALHDIEAGTHLRRWDKVMRGIPLSQREQREWSYHDRRLKLPGEPAPGPFWAWTQGPGHDSR